MKLLLKVWHHFFKHKSTIMAQYTMHTEAGSYYRNYSTCERKQIRESCEVLHWPVSSICTAMLTLCCISCWQWSSGTTASPTTSSTDCSRVASLSDSASLTHWRRHSKCAFSFVLACSALVNTWKWCTNKHVSNSHKTSKIPNQWSK